MASLTANASDDERRAPRRSVSFGLEDSVAPTTSALAVDGSGAGASSADASAAGTMGGGSGSALGAASGLSASASASSLAASAAGASTAPSTPGQSSVGSVGGANGAALRSALKPSASAYRKLPPAAQYQHPDPLLRRLRLVDDKGKPVNLREHFGRDVTCVGFYFSSQWAGQPLKEYHRVSL